MHSCNWPTRQVSAGVLYIPLRNRSIVTNVTNIRATSSTCTIDNNASGPNGIRIGFCFDGGSKIWLRHGDDVFLIPGPTTRAIRSETNSILHWLASAAPISSMARFDAPYGSSGSAGSFSQSGRAADDGP
jgi:hypothetical protein